jgi:hypothetical protein
MRRWFVLALGMTVVALTGTAFALTGGEQVGLRAEEVKTTVAVSTTMLTFEEKPLNPSDGEKPTETGSGHQGKDQDKVNDKVKEQEPKPEKPKDDATAPHLVILHPVDGQVFKQKDVVFQGRTEPGAKVFAGKWEADVDAEGNWRIVLFLSPGGNKATFKAVDAAGNAASASVSVTFDAPVKDSDPKDNKKDDKSSWQFSANQVHGQCSEDPAYDIFHGTGKPGSMIMVLSDFGQATTKINDKGKWEVKVFFESAPLDKTFLVKVKDDYGNYSKFQFTRTD